LPATWQTIQIAPVSFDRVFLQDGVVMAIEHVALPVAAVQFHPESIMTLGQAAGARVIHNVRRLAA
jgi:anthranilate synthase